MCGILGSVNVKIDNNLLDTIKHRGPDRQAIVHDSTENYDVYLAHTRLSIVDLSDAGNQPMTSECGNYGLLFNGEIYNHLELRTELKFKHFKGHSDTETLLYLLMEQGTGAIEKLNGIFGFAFYDKKKGEIILARDSFGVKPVYFYQKNNRLLFSSEIRPIRRIINEGLDRTALGLLLNLRYLPSPYTLYKDIYKVRPGHFFVFKLKGKSIECKVESYLKRAPEKINIPFGQAVELYGEKLSKAVDRQLMGDVEMGMLLSGGIDSAVIAGIATKKYTGKMKAFTVGFDSKYKVNETQLAAETAEYFGMDHHMVSMDASDFFETFTECARIVEEPLATTSFIPMYYLSKKASEYVKVVLTGQGADEPLGGYGRYQGEILCNRYPSMVFQVMNHLVRWSGCKKESLIRGARSLSIKNDVRRFMNEYSLFTTEEVKRMTGMNIERESLNLIDYFYSLCTNQCQTSVDKMMGIDLRMDLADDLLLYTDKVTMNFALECRVPMLDLELTDYLQSLPTEYKVRRGSTKIVHKEFAKKMLPQSIINRPKFGFQSPTDIWFSEKADFIESTMLNGKLPEYISRNELKNVVEKHKKGYNMEKQIFLLLSINEWLEDSMR